MAPALESLRVDVLDSLKGRRSVLGAALGGSRLRAVLIVTQVALSLVMLVGAALFVVTHYQIVTRDVGLQAYQVLMPRVSYRVGGVNAAAATPGPVRMKEALAGVPGAEAVVFAATAPGFGGSKVEIVRADATIQPVDANEVSPGFFRALDIPIVRGRALDERDAPCDSGSCDVVVSEAAVRQLLPPGDPIGRTLLSRSGTVLRVVGRRTRHIHAGDWPRGLSD